MSRSRRKTPISGCNTAHSEKRCKQAWHRAARAYVKQALHVDPEVEILPEDKDMSDPWNMAKDGKRYFDPTEWPKGMRK